MALAACMSTSIEFNLGFFADLLEDDVDDDEDDAERLLRVWGSPILDFQRQLWHNHSPNGISLCSKGGSLLH